MLYVLKVNYLTRESVHVYGGNATHVRQASIADAIPYSHDNDTGHLCDATVQFCSVSAICIWNIYRDTQSTRRELQETVCGAH